jgi:hypothetical protein
MQLKLRMVGSEGFEKHIYNKLDKPQISNSLMNMVTNYKSFPKPWLHLREVVLEDNEY